MSSFIEKSACKGRHPGGVSVHQRRSRSDLVARLLRQRRVARFIIAPDGFGKTSLAYEYAHVIFSFSHVFWVNAKSPCFLRDIDAGTMFNEIIRFDRTPSLVVIEDLPPLDHERVEAFSDLIDQLLGFGDEVLVTCTPSCDSYQGLHRDRMVLDSFDLMLDEAESRVALIDEAHETGGHGEVLPAEMIPCLRWGECGHSVLLAGLNREELALDERLAMFVLLLLQSGRLGDVEAFLGTAGAHAVIERLAPRYPFLGVDLREGVYAAARFDIESLENGYAARFDELAKASSFDQRETLASRCADALMVRGMNDRAVEFMVAFSTKRSCAAWLATRGWDLVAALSPRAFVDAYFIVDRSVQRGRVSLYAMLSWSFLVLDDKANAESFARKAAMAMMGEVSARAIGCVMLLRLGDEPARRKARVTLEKMLLMHHSGVVEEAESAQDEHEELVALWPTLAKLTLAFDDGAPEGVAETYALLEELENGSRFDGIVPEARNMLMMACAWMLDALVSDLIRVGLPSDMQWAREAVLPIPFVNAEIVDRLLHFACECVEMAAFQRERITWFEMRLASALEMAYEHDPLSLTAMPAFAAMSAVRREQLELFNQRDLHRKERSRLPLHADSVRESRRSGARRDHPVNSDMPAHLRPPVMTVSLFGGFEVRIGDEVIDPRVFARNKMRTLMAILVLYRGKEFTRDHLAQMLWPNSSDESARKSFYCLWSKLRKALTVNGDCPYLLRDQYGCRLNPHLVVSDVMQFEQLCRTLLFGRTEEREWESVYAQISMEFSEVLLPGERTNETIISLRAHYHTQLVDALIAASARLAATGETRGALWFAREALRRDHTREDAYVAQMEAQIAAEQRAAALETYFACRRYLARELGIDPSPRIVNLYRAIIESEEDFM